MFVKSAVALAASLLFGAVPALANDAPASAAVQIAGAIEGVTASTADDEAEFSELFASWGELGQGGVVSASGAIISAPRLDVAIPSRMPLSGTRLTSGYGMRSHPVLGGHRQHNGVDLAAPTGTPVYATADGMVGRAQWFSSYGNYVQIEHGGQLQTRYGHLSSYTVAAGQMVQKGDLIGYVGSTGRSTGPHLHYEVRVAGEAVDPTPYMTAQFADVERGRGGQGGE